MATIIKLQRKSGPVYKAIIKKSGLVLKTKTFKTKTAARTWAKRLEADTDILTAMGLSGVSKTFSELCNVYAMQWYGKDHCHLGRVKYWEDIFSLKNIIDITTGDIKTELKKYGR